jgi:GNAT superfamily N-acetyltransferase
MGEAGADLELRTATLDDAEIVAGLESARNPQDPRDPIMLRHWWTAGRTPEEVHMELVAEGQGGESALAYVGAGHDPWDTMPQRFGWIRLLLHPDSWSEARFAQLIDAGESWLRDEAGSISVARARGSLMQELQTLEAHGYREVRRSKVWELDLVACREQLLAGAVRTREQMKAQGVQLLTLDQDPDPDRLAKLYEVECEAERDIPTTVPWRIAPYDDWLRFWFDNPGVRDDRFWEARDGDAVVGLSVIGYPPTRGVPWTFFTGTSRSVRGRGVARALKYQTVAQAIALGAERIRTNNDGANAPILHLNDEMGYRLVDPVIELHRELAT